MFNGTFIMLYLGLTPIVIIIGVQISFWFLNRDIELIIKRAFKKALREIYEESRND